VLPQAPDEEMIKALTRIIHAEIARPTDDREPS
jgi:hypothetical protein